RSRSREAVSQLGAAYSKARALAVRNPAMVGPGMAAATVCLSGDAIHVHVGLPADCGIDSLWRATLSGGSRTQVFADAAMSTDFACIAVDNRARIVAANVDDATCTTASEITVRHGGWNVEASLI